MEIDGTIPERLRVLARWHDMRDDKNEYTGPREVQADLRQAADLMETYIPAEKLIGVVAS